MKLSTFIIIMACSPLLGCAAQETFPPNSPLSWLRNRVFGSRVAEDRFVSRVAVAMQSLVNVVNDPIVVRELRKYYASLLRSPEVAKLVESVRPPNRPSRRRGGVAKTSRTTTTTTTTTPVLSTPTTTTPVPSTIPTTVGPNAALDDAFLDVAQCVIRATGRRGEREQTPDRAHVEQVPLLLRPRVGGSVPELVQLQVPRPQAPEPGAAQRRGKLRVIPDLRDVPVPAALRPSGRQGGPLLQVSYAAFAPV
ncbi:hypothetical protein V5799_012025 [Amblyomma americanum]|uniref:Secreted protein n=1 Tax=Amblyomma americanum TaxID=6943 RepID=A0AAQ4EF74_AMBAM